MRALLTRVRDRSPFAARALRSGDRYLAVNGSLLAAGLTYYGFLALFPLLAVALGVSALAARLVPSFDETVRQQLAKVLPEGIDLNAIASAGLTVGVVGLVVLLYAGVRWVGSLRRAFYLIWGVEPREVPYVTGVVRDFVTLLLLGACLIASVAVTVGVSVATGALSSVFGLDGAWLSLVVRLLGMVVSLGTDLSLFYLLFRSLPPRGTSHRSLLQGSMVAAVGFEMLKQAATLLLASVHGNVVYGTFAVTVGLLVWIGYASRLVLLAGAWAGTGD